MLIFVAIGVMMVLVISGYFAYIHFAEDDAIDESDEPTNRKSASKSSSDEPLNAQTVLLNKTMTRAVWVNNGFGYITNGKYADKKIEYDSCVFDPNNNTYVIVVRFAPDE